MDAETVVLPTSSRPPPAGQDAVEFKEGEMRHSEYQGGKELCYDGGKPFQGTPRNLSCQNPVEKSQKFVNTQESFTFRESYNTVCQRTSSGCCSHHSDENWRTNFESLLYDTEGRRILHEYLTRERHAILLDCLGACEVFRTLPLTSDLYVSARDIYKRFIQFRDPKLRLRDYTRNKVNHCMRSSSYHSLMFDEVERDVLNELKCIWYDKFLSSDFYLNYRLSASQIPDHESKPFLPSSEGLTMPTVEEECTGDLREKDGAHVKEFKGKSIKFIDELSRRSLQEANAPCRYSEQTNLAVEGKIDQEDAIVQSKDSRSISGPVMTSDLMSKRERQKNNAHEDNLPILPHFKPRTERINRETMTLLKPEEFARVLCEKLEKVIRDRELAEEAAKETKLPVSEESDEFLKTKGESASRTTVPAHLPSGDDVSLAKSTCLSHSSYPLSDRYSVAGMSSTSGSEVKSDSQLKYRHGAKELASAVHHALRTELKECHCQQCVERQKTFRKADHQAHHTPRQQEAILPQNVPCPHCKHLPSDPYAHQRNNNGPHVKLTSVNLESLQAPQSSVDVQRIYSWIEHNERYRSEMANPHVLESPRDTPLARRKHRPPVVYDTTRPAATDYHCVREPGNIPLADTNRVLQEAKRRLEDNTRGVSRSSRKPGRSSGSRPHQPYIEPEYAETALSGMTGNWTLSDSASSVSRNQVPSVISSIPSSASQYIDESISDFYSESVRSHGSKGHEKTVVTYFLGLEPMAYRTSLAGKNITLGQFKAAITKKGNYRYFFKTLTKDDGVVYQQIEADHEVLPKFENKIVGKVKKVE